MSLDEALDLRKRDPEAYQSARSMPWRKHVEGMLRLQKMGAVTFDYGNNIRTFAFQRGVKNAYDFPGFVPAYIRPLFCEGRGPFRWVALSGEPATSTSPTNSCSKCSPTTASCAAGSTSPASASSSRACPRASAGWDTASAPSLASP